MKEGFRRWPIQVASAPQLQRPRHNAIFSQRYTWPVYQDTNVYVAEVETEEETDDICERH